MDIRKTIKRKQNLGRYTKEPLMDENLLNTQALPRWSFPA
jgi:hypothetical protein